MFRELVDTLQSTLFLELTRHSRLFDRIERRALGFEFPCVVCVSRLGVLCCRDVLNPAGLAGSPPPRWADEGGTCGLPYRGFYIDRDVASALIGVYHSLEGKGGKQVRRLPRTGNFVAVLGFISAGGVVNSWYDRYDGVSSPRSLQPLLYISGGKSLLVAVSSSQAISVGDYWRDFRKLVLVQVALCFVTGGKYFIFSTGVAWYYTLYCTWSRRRGFRTLGSIRSSADSMSNGSNESAGGARLLERQPPDLSSGLLETINGVIAMGNSVERNLASMLRKPFVAISAAEVESVLSPFFSLCVALGSVGRRLVCRVTWPVAGNEASCVATARAAV
ncbi:hypothetical protein GOBAR_AA34592 [Gossypium barbadense]|uniref:Uncharacterized protein n=1 Tax=Gossypium barbadense TaxID=3634 RepID=A0A2P5W4V4_GOSBA|nr:hypothetical protein GOBAR_AA34592 [Gossypium barbadense]